MVHAVEEHLLFTPDFIEKLVKKEHPASYSKLAKVTGVSLNTIKSYDKNKKIPNNSTSKEFITKATSHYTTPNSDLNKLFLHLEKGNLYQYLINNHIEHGLIYPHYPAPWREFFGNFEYLGVFTSDYPKTKKILLSLEETKHMLQCFLKKDDFISAEKCILQINFPGFICVQNINKNYRRAKGGKNFFRKSISPYLIQCNLYCIASYEIELYESLQKKENLSFNKKDKDFVCGFDMLIPKLISNTLKPPITLWFDSIKAVYNHKDSWTTIIDNGVFYNYETIDSTLLRKWIKGQHIPERKNLIQFLKALFPDKNLYYELLLYTIARIFQYIYEQLIKLRMKNQNIIEFFRVYTVYRESLFNDLFEKTVAG